MMLGMVAQDREQVLKAVERVGAVLSESGMPRMAARVFAYALAEDADRYTAAELAEGLGVSPAAVSGAVRYLTASGLMFKERAPGVRADIYRIDNGDVWSAVLGARFPLLELWERSTGEAARMVGLETRGGRRLAETEAFFRFWREEMRDSLERWRDHRRTLSSSE
jgi:DNA-binding transcriptional ArsR family regulator